MLSKTRALLRISALTLSLVAASAGPSPAFERPEIHFDDRIWKVGYEVARENQIMVEFILENETIDHWTELVTTQFFKNLQQKTSLENYLASTKKSIQERCASLQWNVVRSTKSDVIYEWSVSGCAGVADQSEIARVIKGAEGIHVLHYAIRAPALPSKKRKEWLALLTQARLLT